MVGKYDFKIRKGSSFEKRISWKDKEGVLISLAGLTPKMQVRELKENGTLIADFSSKISVVDNKIEIKLTPTETNLFTFEKKGIPMLYDLVLEGVNLRIPLLEGRILVSYGVTE